MQGITIRTKEEHARPSLPHLRDLDEVAAGVVEDGGGDGAHRASAAG